MSHEYLLLCIEPLFIVACHAKCALVIGFYQKRGYVRIVDVVARHALHFAIHEFDISCSPSAFCVRRCIKIRINNRRGVCHGDGMVVTQIHAQSEIRRAPCVVLRVTPLTVWTRTIIGEIHGN